MTKSAIFKKYSTERKFIAHLESVLWNNAPICPYCQSTYHTPAPKEGRYHCNNCKTSYSVTTGTMFHKTRVDLRLWAFVIASMLESKNHPVRELGELIGVTKDTALFMMNRIKPEILNNRDTLKKIIAL